MTGKKQKNPLLLGTLLLTASGLIARIAGFFYRIFLSHKISTEAMGLYQLVYPMYSICFSLCCGSIQTALSRFVAAEYTKKDEGNSRRYLACGLVLALSLALLAAGGMYFFAPFLALHVLGDSRCGSLLRIMAFSVPLSAVHACICGYYYGRSKARIPAAAQIAEQFIRILTVVTVIHIAEASGKEVTAVYAVIGHLAGEVGALSVSLLSFLFHMAGRQTGQSQLSPKPDTGIRKDRTGALFSALAFLALPLMANRLVLSLLQSMEAILIPGRLQLYGLSPENALSLYGILTGMALPFILFPTAVTGSLSVMLLPHIARAQSESAYDSISYSAGMSVRYSLYIGILFAGIFLRFGREIGPVVFHNQTAGDFLSVLAWLCPFLYVSGTLTSITNGLGYTKTSFFHMILSLSVRLLSVVVFIPFMGIKAYLYGLLASELSLTAAHLVFLQKKIELPFSPVYELLRPAMAALTAAGVSLGLEALPAMETLPALIRLSVSGCIFVLFFGLFLYITRVRRR